MECLYGLWFDAPLNNGKVIWYVHDSTQSEANLFVVFMLKGAEANHTYLAGIHFFNPTNPAVKPDVSSFAGSYCAEGVVTRDGVSAYSIGYDFGNLTTDASGNGSVQFNLSVPVGTYYAQFTFRYDPWCFGRAVYRTGYKYAGDFETITVR